MRIDENMDFGEQIDEIFKEMDELVEEALEDEMDQTLNELDKTIQDDISELDKLNKMGVDNKEVQPETISDAFIGQGSPCGSGAGCSGSHYCGGY